MFRGASPNMQQQQQMMPTAVYVSSPGNIQLQPTSGYNTVLGAANPNSVNAYALQRFIKIGRSLICIGFLAIITNGVAFVSGDILAMIGHGFWCGFLFIVTGGIGIKAVNTNRYLIFAMGMLRVCTIAAIILLLICFGGVSINISEHSSNVAAVVMESILAILAVGALVCLICGIVTFNSIISVPNLVQQPGTVHLNNLQRTAAPLLSNSTPAYGHQPPLPQGYWPVQQPYVTPSFTAPSSSDGRLAATAPPAYTELYDQKLYV